jgi:SAM-dependent methyltransferase
MQEESRKEHWEHVYQTKGPEQVSWTQHVPQTSLNFIRGFNLPKNARIIDIGGGDSMLVDFLLLDGYTDITVLDISESALEKAKARLGEKHSLVTWIVSDITQFQPEGQFDLWHDRAAFHFLTTPQQIGTYLGLAEKTVSGFMVIGTFSESGPEKCSGLPIKQYSVEHLTEQFSNGFTKLNCFSEIHTTPFKTTQSFSFCSFEKTVPLTHK